MKFKKLVLITASTVVAGGSLIALAAACHDKSLKSPGIDGDNKTGNSDSKKTENKSQQKNQKQITNPELKQKQVDKTDQKQLENSESLNPKVTQKHQENLSNNSNKENKENSSSSETEMQDKLKNKQKPQIQQSSDIYFLDNKAVINQEPDYNSYLKLKLANPVTPNENNVLRIILTEKNNPINKITAEANFYSENQSDKIDLLTIYLGNLKENKTYLLTSAFLVNYIDKKEDKKTELNLSDEIKNKPIVIERIKYKHNPSNEEKEKIPVTIKANLTKLDNNDNEYQHYKINLTLSTKENTDANSLNQKYLNLFILYSNKNMNWNTLFVDNQNYQTPQIIDNKAMIEFKLRKSFDINNEIQVRVQRITDEKGSLIDSSKFRLNFEDSNSEFDADKNQIFKFKLANAINEKTKNN